MQDGFVFYPWLSVFIRGFFLSPLPNLRSSEVKPEAQGQGPVVRQLSVQVERVEMIVSVSQIQKPHSHLRPPPRETVTGKHIELPKVIAGPFRQIALVVLG